MKYARHCLLIFTCCLVFLAPLFAAESYDRSDPYHKFRNDEIEYDDSNDVPWKEQSVEVPPPPTDDADSLINLSSVVDAPQGFEMFIDGSTLTVNEKDEIVRYWLVLKASGAVNKMYEGVRCGTGSYKPYAFAGPSGKVSRMRKPAWIAASQVGQAAYRYWLEQRVFCLGTVPRRVDDILAIARDGSVPNTPLNWGN